MDFVISKPQLNHHLKNNMLISVKKPNFEPEARNSEETLQTRYELFMKWKDSDLDYTKNCIFIDEARSAVGTSSRVETPKLECHPIQLSMLYIRLVLSMLL